jgi:hypothetical protein
MKHIHLYYDYKEDEIVLAGRDNRPIGYYSISDPNTPLRALMAETILDEANQQEDRVRRKKEED